MKSSIVTVSPNSKKHREEAPVEKRLKEYINNYKFKLNEIQDWITAYCCFKSKLNKEERDIIDAVITLMGNPLMVDATRSVLDCSYTSTVIPPKDAHDFYIRSEEQAYDRVLVPSRGKQDVIPANYSARGVSSTKGKLPTPVGLTKKDVMELAKARCKKLDELKELREKYAEN